MFRRFFHLQACSTPNPSSVKIILHQQQKVTPWITQTVNLTPNNIQEFSSQNNVKNMCSKLFQNEHITNIFLSSDFISINVKENQVWQTYWDEMMPIIQRFYFENALEPIIGNYTETEQATDQKRLYTDPLEQQVENIIEQYIRPVVLSDGGNIVLKKVVDQIAYVELQGSCKSCSSSSFTLKNNVENTIKYFLPDIIQVKQYE